jgi:uncharacterized membrane protein
MKKKEFIRRLDHPAIEEAIAQAERTTSGQIRVVVTHVGEPTPLPAAQKMFLKLGMDKTKHRNAVLIFVAPVSHTFAVIGDEAVHSKCGDSFWQELAAAMTRHFKRAEFTTGLVHGVARAGALLAGHFPRQPDDRDELPNQVVEE